MPKGPPEGYRRAGATGGGSTGASGGGRGGGRGSGSRPLLPKGSSFRATPKPSKSSTSQQPKSPQTKYGVKTGSMRSAPRSSQQSKQASASWRGVKSGTRAAKPSGTQPNPTTQPKPASQQKSPQKPSTTKPDRSGAKGAAVGAGAAALMGATGLLLTKAAQEKKNPPSSPSAPSKVKPQQGMRKTLGGVRAIYDKGRWIPLADYNRKTPRG